ncbi:MAG: DUF4919 domain-containing protein [Caulobacterales bacterium]
MRATVPLAALALALAAAAPVRAAPAAATPDPEAHYQSLLAAAKAADPGIEGWRDLRYAYAKTPAYSPEGAGEGKMRMLQAFRSGDCQATLAAARTIGEIDYVEPDAHLISSVCLDKLGQDAAAKHELGVGMGLITSIETTGDGLSAAHAMTVITVDEEYSVLRALNRPPLRQALVRDGGHSYDVMTTKGDKGGEVTYFFLIDGVMAAEAAELAPGAVSEGGPPR